MALSLTRLGKVLTYLLLVVMGVVTGCSKNNSVVGSAALSESSCQDKAGYKLINGQILTLDSQDSVVSSLIVSEDRILAVGENMGAVSEDNCYEVVDLQGKTVIPGLIDSHMHFIRAGLAPGHDLRDAETTFTIPALQELIETAANNLAQDKVITVMGGVLPQQFTEKRYPTIQELDAVVSEHVFYAQQGFNGPAFTNSVGKKFFTDHDVIVSDDGTIDSGEATASAFAVLKSFQSLQDAKQSLTRIQTHANRLGLTTVFDEAGVGFPGGGFFDSKTDYVAYLELWREHNTTVRIRAQRASFDGEQGRGEVEEFLDNAWWNFGDDMLKVTALGEHIVTFPREGKISSAYDSKLKAIAKFGWSHEQHSSSFAENQQHMAAIEGVHVEHSITELRWSLSHVFELGENNDLSMIEKLKSMGMGVRVQNQAYSIPTDQFPLGRVLGGDNAGPLYRILIDSGIHMGAGTDGALVGPMNPWLSIYYMVTGRDSGGQLINEGQTLSRLEALRLYTINNAWFSFEELQIGSLEVGKKADLVVLNADYLNVPEEDIRNLRSMMTMVDGKIVYMEK